MIAKPNPGSKEAIDAGCTCPVLDNGRGRGACGGAKGDDGQPMFWVHDDCPIHSKKLEESA